MRLLRSALVVMAVGLFSVKAEAAPVLIDFDSLADLTDITNQFAGSGVLFTGALALAAGSTGGSLNEFDFPPFSGDNVAFESGDGMRIDFLTGASSVSGLFTYAAPLTLTAYAADGSVLGSVVSQFGENLGTGTNQTNELLTLALSSTITYVIVSGTVGGGSFVLDNLSVNTVDGTEPVPEPASATLLLIGAGTMWATRRRRARSYPPNVEH
jgi:hypothetical protein